MKFLMLMIPRVYQPGTPAAERAGDDFAPPLEAMEKMGKFNEELAKAATMIEIDGLEPIAKGARVTFDGGAIEHLPAFTKIDRNGHRTFDPLLPGRRRIWRTWCPASGNLAETILTRSSTTGAIASFTGSRARVGPLGYRAVRAALLGLRTFDGGFRCFGFLLLYGKSVFGSDRRVLDF